MKSLLVLTLLAGSAIAQDCPINISYAHQWRNDYVSYLLLSFKNSTEKRVVETNFGAVVLDAAGDPHPLMAQLRSRKKLKPGETTHSQHLGPLGREVLDPHTKVTLRAWVQTVQFEDGTSWKDDGAHACTLETK